MKFALGIVTCAQIVSQVASNTNNNREKEIYNFVGNVVKHAVLLLPRSQFAVSRKCLHTLPPSQNAKSSQLITLNSENASSIVDRHTSTRALPLTICHTTVFHCAKYFVHEDRTETTQKNV